MESVRGAGVRRLLKRSFIQASSPHDCVPPPAGGLVRSFVSGCAPPSSPGVAPHRTACLPEPGAPRSHGRHRPKKQQRSAVIHGCRQARPELRRVATPARTGEGLSSPSSAG
jgi:hypothetical protein